MTEPHELENYTNEITIGMEAFGIITAAARKAILQVDGEAQDSGANSIKLLEATALLIKCVSMRMNGESLTDIIAFVNNAVGFCSTAQAAAIAVIAGQDFADALATEKAD